MHREDRRFAGGAVGIRLVVQEAWNVVPDPAYTVAPAASADVEAAEPHGDVAVVAAWDGTEAAEGQMIEIDLVAAVVGPYFHSHRGCTSRGWARMRSRSPEAEESHALAGGHDRRTAC